jgi:hypothetical protein
VTTPTLIRKSIDNKRIKDICCGGVHSAAMTVVSKLYTWGNNSYGQLGTGDTINRAEPHLAMNYVLAFFCGNDFTLAMKDNLVLSGWGDNFFGTYEKEKRRNFFSILALIFLA